MCCHERHLSSITRTEDRLVSQKMTSSRRHFSSTEHRCVHLVLNTVQQQPVIISDLTNLLKTALADPYRFPVRWVCFGQLLQGAVMMR